MSEKNEIHEFILGSERNLHLAYEVAKTWPEVRKSIIKGFLDRLGKKLKEELKGWQTEINGTFYEDHNAKFYLYKPAWESLKRYILLECYEKENNENKKLAFGVFRSLDKLNNNDYFPEILERVKEEFPSAVSSKWWEARDYLRKPFSDWQSPDILWKMHNKDDTFFDSIYDKLRTVAKIAKPLLDERL